MAAERIPERNEIPVEFTWDLTDIFKSDEDWLREYEALMQVPEQLAEYEGTLGESAARLLEYMQLDDEVSVRLEKLMGYAGCKADQDTADSRYQDMRSKGVGCCVAISGAASFATPELIAIPEETLDACYRRSARSLRPTAATCTACAAARSISSPPPRSACSPLPGRWPTRRILSAAH